MSRLVPYPLLSLALLVMWLLLTRFSLGHLILGSGIALIAGKAMAEWIRLIRDRYEALLLEIFE